jgi:hypothetical protein
MNDFIAGHRNLSPVGKPQLEHKYGRQPSQGSHADPRSEATVISC